MLALDAYYRFYTVPKFQVWKIPNFKVPKLKVGNRSNDNLGPSLINLQILKTDYQYLVIDV